MGRKTLESFPKALPDREHIVVTRDKNYVPKFPCIVVHSLDEAFQLADGDAAVYIIGGGEIYAQAMQASTKIELTRIHASFPADTFFPEVDTDLWQLVSEEHHPKDERHAFDFTYQTFVKKAS